VANPEGHAPAGPAPRSASDCDADDTATSSIYGSEMPSRVAALVFACGPSMYMTLLFVVAADRNELPRQHIRRDFYGRDGTRTRDLGVTVVRPRLRAIPSSPTGAS
jgi:hypothetical protein